MGILNDDQVADLRDAFPSKVKPATLRKREQRAREYASKVAAKKEADTLTPDAFWEKNSRSVDTGPLLEQQERVWDKLYWMECQLDGSYNDPTSDHYTDPNDPDYVSLEEGAANLAEFIERYGTCEMFIMYLKFWQGPDGFAKSLSQFKGSAANRRFQEQAENNQFPHVYDFMKRDNATSIFARFGILTAVPSHRLYEWETFLASKRPPTPQQANGYVKMTCSSPTCGNAITSKQIVSESIAADYTRLGKLWLCALCKNLEAKSRAESTLVKGSR